METELPLGWGYRKLGDLSSICSSKRIFKHEYVDKGVPFFRTKEIVELNQGSKISLELFISEDKYNKIKLKFGVPSKGDILISAVGTIGITWIVDNRKFYFKDGNLLWIKNFKDVLPEYLDYALKLFVNFKLTEFFRGSAYNALTMDNLRTLEIPIPFPDNKEKSLTIQKQIVVKLDAFFNEYKTLKQEKEKVRENHEKILQSAIIKLLFMEAEKNKWSIKNLPDVAEIIMGQSPPSSSYNQEGKGLPFYQGKKEFGKKYPTVIQWCSNPSKTAEKNDILLCVRAPVGPINMATEKCCIGRGLAAIRANDTLEPEYLYYFMKGNEINISFLGRGSTFDSIGRKDIAKIKIPVPPTKKIQLELVKKIESLAIFEDTLSKENVIIFQNINILPTSVLSKAFRGELI